MSEPDSEWIWIDPSVWDAIGISSSPATTIGVLITLASLGGELICTASDLVEETGVTPRRLVQILKKLENREQISIEGGGATRKIRITSEFIRTSGTWLGASVEASREFGWADPSRGASLWRAGSVPERTRRRIFDRDGYVCRWCGTTTGKFHIDHIKAVALGGKDNDENLCVSCAPCNLSKGAKKLGDWKP